MHIHEGYDARYCLNCVKELEERPGHFVVVRQLPKGGYLYYANGKWSKSLRRATIFIDNHSYDEVYREAYQMYQNVRVMPRTAFGK
jgi:hypothetical protein